MAAPPGSAIRTALDKGWSREAHLLANLQEQRAGVLDVKARYERPGVPEDQTERRSSLFPADSMTMEELDRVMAENYARGRAPTNKD